MKVKPEIKVNYNTIFLEFHRYSWSLLSSTYPNVRTSLYGFVKIGRKIDKIEYLDPGPSKNWKDVEINWTERCRKENLSNEG